MQVIIVLIAASLTIAVGFLIAYLWAVKSGQYEDGFTPAVRILLDEDASDIEVGNSSSDSNK